MTLLSLRCSHAGCASIRSEQEPYAGEDPQLCARHRQLYRIEQGACLNCGAPLSEHLELNALTGRPLLRNGEHVKVRTCSAGCGYTQRKRRRRNKR